MRQYSRFVPICPPAYSEAGACYEKKLSRLVAITSLHSWSDINTIRLSLATAGIVYQNRDLFFGIGMMPLVQAPVSPPLHWRHRTATALPHLRPPDLFKGVQCFCFTGPVIHNHIIGPRFPSRTEIALPIPREPPVTSAIFFISPSPADLPWC